MGIVGASALLLTLTFASTACLRATQYRCTGDEQCAPGRCEAEGYCSFADAECASGQRFSDLAGSLSDTCVGQTSTTDAGVDSVIVPSDCPGDFTTITGGEAGHLYKLVSQTDEWIPQRNGCANMGTAYLAIPGTPQELAALFTLSGGDKIWLGITDAAVEGTWVDVNDMVQTFLPWKSGSPTVNPANNIHDCVIAESATEIVDEECEQQYAAVCECAP